jgi:hypothetical protein
LIKANLRLVVSIAKKNSHIKWIDMTVWIKSCLQN